MVVVHGEVVVVVVVVVVAAAEVVVVVVVGVISKGRTFFVAASLWALESGELRVES